MTPLISVVIPTRDRPETLHQALVSVAAQRLDGLELLVVNDGGSAVEPVLAAHRDALDVRLITLPAETGPSAARNVAIEVARGQYLAFLDDDDVFLPGHLAAALALLTGGGVDAVYATALVSDRRIDPAATTEVNAPEAFDFAFDANFLSVLNYVPPAGVVLRAGVIRFNPSLRAGEDWDLWLRLSRDHGYRFVHLDRPGAVYHRLPAHATSDDPIANGAKALRMFHDGYRRMCARWPVSAGSLAALYRGHVLRTYELAFERYAAGRTLDSYWYERLVRLLHGGFAAGDRTLDRTPELAAILGGAPGRG